MMTTYEYDADVVRWGLHQLLDVCSLSSGAPRSVTHYDTDFSSVEYVREGECESTNHIYVENDEVIAFALQEELSRVADSEASGGSSQAVEEHQQVSVLAQDWLGPPKSQRLGSPGLDICHGNEGEIGKYSSHHHGSGEKSIDGEAQLCSPELAYESVLDGEVGKRLNQMVPIPHVPKINGQIPSDDEETSDHQRLMNRLQLYDLVELKVSGDGNCQFRSLSDQVYRTTEHHEFVRKRVIDQFKSHPELYEGYVPMAFDDYLKKMSKNGEWGDHVTLQAAADAYGVRIFIITSFKDTCYIEILPYVQKSNRIIFLSFWAEVHYNSIYLEEDFPILESKKKKSWWRLGN